jgi:cysteine desulfurase family protein
MIYLDNAATTFPKPRRVWEEMERCMKSYGGNPGRGSHRLAMRAAEKIYECRELLADMMGSRHPENVIFTSNATAAINLAVKGLLREGDHLLISDLEHNAVWRPVEQMARLGGITYDVFSSMLENEAERDRRTPTRICARIAALLKPNTRAVLCSHQSNVCSATMPLAEIGAFCRRHGLLFLVDASQSAGHLPIDMQAMSIDGLCAPGHKGLLGIQGCGFAVFGEGLCPDTLVEGGSGYASLEPTMPDELPERAEAGTLPTPAIAGLAAGLDYLRSVGLEAIAAHERELFRALRERMETLDGYRIARPEYEGSTLMFYREGVPSDRIGAYLAERGICVRTGYHCAALAHNTLHSPEGGGVRVSFGPFNTLREVDALYGALRQM